MGMKARIELVAVVVVQQQQSDDDTDTEPIQTMKEIEKSGQALASVTRRYEEVTRSESEKKRKK